MINVLIVDDHELVIEGFKLLLKPESDITVIGHELSGDAAIKNIHTHNPDVILLDINMPGTNGIDTCKQLLKIQPDLKIVAITMHKESSLIKMMLSNGAKGYVLKNASKEELIRAIKTVHTGSMYLDNTANEIVINTMANAKKSRDADALFPKLSRREKEVLILIMNEHTTQEIADKLCIGFGTVETHRRNMLIKTGTRNTAGLVRVTLEYDLHK